VIPCQDRVTDIFVSADETRLAAVLATGQVQLFVVDEQGFSLLNHNGKAVNSAVFSADGRFLTTGCDDRLLRVWECDTGSLRGLPLLHPDRILSVAANGDEVLSVCEDGQFRRWQLAKPASHAVMKISTPSHALVSPGGRYVLLAAKNGRTNGATDSTGMGMGLFDPESGVAVHSADAATLSSLGRVVSMQFAGENNIVVAGVRSVHFLSAQNLAQVKPPLTNLPNSAPDTVIADVATSDDLTALAMRLSDGKAYIFSWGKSLPIRKWPLEGVTSIAISPDGTTVSAGNDQGEVHLIDALSGRFIASQSRSDSAIDHLEFSPSGTQLAVTTFPAGLQLLNAQTLAVELVCDHPPEEEVQSIDFQRDGSSVSIVSNIAIRSWDANTGLQTMFRVRSDTKIPADISPDGQFLVDGNIVKTTQLTAEGTAEEIRIALERSSGIRLTEDGAAQFIDTTD